MKRQSGLKRFTAVFIPPLLMMAFILFPFYWIFVTSVKPQDELYEAVAIYWPGHITFEAYSRLFITAVNFSTITKNNFIVTSLTTIVSLTASTLTAYAFFGYQFIGGKILICILLCNNMFPTILLLIPLYAIMREMGLLHTPISSVLSYTILTIPLSIRLLLGFLDDLPMSLEEAALVNRCSGGSAFLKIILPTLGPYLVAIGIYIPMTSQSEYTFAMMLANTDARTIPAVLKSLIGQLSVQRDLLTAGGIITIISVYIIFFFAQKRLVEGLTAGAVRGQL